jgi:hypothetical protein
MDGRAARHNFERGPSKVWSKLAQYFLRKRLKCEKLTLLKIEITSNGQNCCI